MAFKIGDIEIKNPVVMAPMAGVSDTSYRKIIKEMGAGLVYAEMVSDKAIAFNNEKTIKMLKMSEKERPIAQQIFGSDNESFVIAAKRVEELMHPDIIDINMGCPVPKVALKAQAGSALLKDIEKIKEIVSAVVNAVSIPVTVKIRSGWDDNHINAVEVAKAVEEAGASAISIHARTRSQGYSGKADWDIIKQVKENVSIPVIGNGDVNNVDDFKRMMDYTGCDAVMIGRGCIGNPWIINDCVNYYLNKPLKEVTIEEKIALIKRHLEMLIEDTNEKVAILEMRTHLMYYFKHFKNNKSYKVKLCQAKTKEEIFRILDDYLANEI